MKQDTRDNFTESAAHPWLEGKPRCNIRACRRTRLSPSARLSQRSHADLPAAERGRGPSHPLKTGSAPPHCPHARVGRRPLWTRTLGAEVPRRRAQRMNSAPAEQPGDRSPKQLSKRARHGRPPRLPRGRGSGRTSRAGAGSLNPAGTAPCRQTGRRADPLHPLAPQDEVKRRQRRQRLRGSSRGSPPRTPRPRGRRKRP